MVKATTQQKQKRKRPDIRARGKDFTVTYRQPSWLRWKAQIVITPTFGLMWSTTFKARAIRFRADKVRQVLYRPATWSQRGLVVFSIDMTAKQADRLRSNPVTPLTVEFTHWKTAGIQALVEEGANRCHWDVQN